MALQVGAMKGKLKSIPVKYVLYNRGSILSLIIYCHHHFGNYDDLSLWVLFRNKEYCKFIYLFIYLFIYSTKYFH